MLSLGFSQKVISVSIQSVTNDGYKKMMAKFNFCGIPNRGEVFRAYLRCESIS